MSPCRAGEAWGPGQSEEGDPTAAQDWLICDCLGLGSIGGRQEGRGSFPGPSPLALSPCQGTLQRPADFALRWIRAYRMIRNNARRIGSAKQVWPGKGGEARGWTRPGQGHFSPPADTLPRILPFDPQGSLDRFPETLWTEPRNHEGRSLPAATTSPSGCHPSIPLALPVGVGVPKRHGPCRMPHGPCRMGHARHLGACPSFPVRPRAGREAPRILPPSRCRAGENRRHASPRHEKTGIAAWWS